MLDFLLDNLVLAMAAAFSGTLALVYWMRPADPGQVEPMSAIQMLNSNQGLYLDVRPKEQFTKGHIVNSKNIPFDELDAKAKMIEKFKAKPVIVVCERGSRSPAATKKLRQLGFEKVFLIRGGIQNWTASNFPLSRS